jgi:two-component system CitB family sensor kinase
VQALQGRSPDAGDIPLVNDGVLLILNRFTITPPRARPEVVSTLRDLTELVTLQQELGSTRQATEALRAQAHEFANRLHTISVLIQLGDAPSAADYIDTVTRDRTLLDHAVLTRIEEPAVAAILVAKASLARERGVTLTLLPTAALPRVGDEMALDLVTVIGNLVDNSFDAVSRSERREVELGIAASVRDDGSIDDVTVVVRDSGPGIDLALGERVFEVGVTSKAHGQRADHGFGLAIVKLIVTRRGGRVTYTNDDGTTFTARLPEASGAPLAPRVPQGADHA